MKRIVILPLTSLVVYFWGLGTQGGREHDTRRPAEKAQPMTTKTGPTKAHVGPQAPVRAAKPTIRVDGLLLGENASTAECQLRQVLKDLRVKLPAIGDIFVPVDSKAIVERDGKLVPNKNHKLSRGFAVVSYRERDALAAFHAQEALDGLRYDGSTLSAKFEKGRPAAVAAAKAAAEAKAKAVAAAEALEKELVPAAPCDVTQVEFPTLPEPAAKQRPVLVTKPAERISDAASDSAASSAPTVQERWVATQAVHLKCTYCKLTGHGVKACPALAAVRCGHCGCSGHTAKRCPEKKAETAADAEEERLEAEWRAYDARQALLVEQRSEAFAQREAEAAIKAAGVLPAVAVAGKAGAFDCLECEEGKEPQQEEVAAVAAPTVAATAAEPKAKRPSKAQRQAAKRVAAKQALAADTSEC